MTVWISRADPPIAPTGEGGPLAGMTVAVKDNIDVAGLPTTAACPSFAYLPAADAACVDALRKAGAAIAGKTNMDQFATGLVGTRSPYGICPNAHWPELISGGSSSGSAVAVARGEVDVALGTDTAGSGRVPAACNGIVGFKPTRGRIPATGVVPACRSLDCVSLFARDVATVAAAAAVFGIEAEDVPRDGAEWRIGGLWGEPVDLVPFIEAGSLLYDGAFVAERYAAVGEFVEQADDADPTVRQIICSAKHIPAWQLFRDRERLDELAARAAQVWRTIDVLAIPTVPRVPTVAEVLADPIGVNTMLGTYTNFVNLLDLCALTVPVGEPAQSGPPSSVTLIAPRGADGRLLSAANQLRAACGAG